MLLDDFEIIMDSVNGSISETDRNGRIVTHLVHEFVNDLVPNYCFNSSTQRFIKASVLFTEPPPKRSFPKAKLMHLYGSKVDFFISKFRNVPFHLACNTLPIEMFFRRIT